jgi:hypothetical protein
MKREEGFNNRLEHYINLMEEMKNDYQSELEDFDYEGAREIHGQEMENLEAKIKEYETAQEMLETFKLAIEEINADGWFITDFTATSGGMDGRGNSFLIRGYFMDEDEETNIMKVSDHSNYDYSDIMLYAWNTKEEMIEEITNGLKGLE